MSLPRGNPILSTAASAPLHQPSTPALPAPDTTHARSETETVR
jgi:hypothetical protein